MSLLLISLVSYVSALRSPLADVQILRENEKKILRDFAVEHGIKSDVPQQILKEILSFEWHKDNTLCKFLEGILSRLAAIYLVNTKKRGLAVDPVANFHLQNGAKVYSINWLGNLTPQGA